MIHDAKRQDGQLGPEEEEVSDDSSEQWTTDERNQRRCEDQQDEDEKEDAEGSAHFSQVIDHITPLFF